LAWSNAKSLFEEQRASRTDVTRFLTQEGILCRGGTSFVDVGPHDIGPTPSGKLVFDAIAHELPPMLPPGGSAVVDARDVAVGMLRIAEIGRSGERYILSGDFAELADIITNLAGLTGAKPPKKHISLAAVVALATASETWSRITRTASPLAVEAVRLMNARLRVTPAKAERELGVTFRPFDITLADTVAWARTSLQETSKSTSLILSSIRKSAINSRLQTGTPICHNPVFGEPAGTWPVSRSGVSVRRRRAAYKK
jgi:hypothetical protein